LPAGNIGASEGKFFAHLRAGQATGLEPTAFSNTTDATGPGENDFNSPVLMQAFYQLNTPLDMGRGEIDGLEFTVGRIDPFGFFDGNNVADDESEGFINLNFVHNPLLDQGDDVSPGGYGSSPGLRLAYVTDINGINHFTASIGTFGSGPRGDFGGSFGKPFTIGQLEYSGRTIGNYEGAYRLYSWRNGEVVYDEDNNLVEKRAGWGLSVDQQISSHAALFARYGKSTEGQRPDSFDKALTVGATVTGLHWGRSADSIGFAAGELWASSGSGSEKLYEIFYKWMPNEQIQVTPHVQRITSPQGDSSASDITVTGVRTKFSF
jgi:hypothetical protein